MQDYMKQARNGEITFVEAYVQAYNEKTELMKNPNPTNKEFKKHEHLTKQLALLTQIITEETIKKDGFTFNNKAQKWQKTNERKNTA